MRARNVRCRRTSAPAGKAGQRHRGGEREVGRSMTCLLRPASVPTIASAAPFVKQPSHFPGAGPVRTSGQRAQLGAPALHAAPFEKVGRTSGSTDSRHIAQLTSSGWQLRQRCQSAICGTEAVASNMPKFVHLQAQIPQMLTSSSRQISVAVLRASVQQWDMRAAGIIWKSRRDRRGICSGFLQLVFGRGKDHKRSAGSGRVGAKPLPR